MRTKYIRAMCIAVASVAVIMTAAQVAEGNLLKNPGFEKVGAGGVPENWAREFNEKLAGPFMAVKDAHEGKTAVCMMTEEWNFLRPNFLTQEAPLPLGATVCHLSAWCKGQGSVNLVFQFRKDRKPLETETVDMGFGPTAAPRESRNEFGLEQDYQQYAASVAIPTGAVSVLVKVGNTCGMFDRFNVWGKLIVDDVSLTADSKPDTSAPSHPLTPTVETPAGLTDIAPYARITGQPAMYDAGLLVDGDINTRFAYAGGLDRSGNVNFLFPKALPVSAVQLALTSWAGVRSFTVRGDCDGDGRYETLLGRADNLNMTNACWVTVTTDNTPVQAIRIQALTGRLLYDFRWITPFVSEAKILTPGKGLDLAELQNWAAFRRPAAPPSGVPEIAMKPVAFSVPPLAKNRFRKMVCADIWVWGVNASTPDAKIPDFRGNPGFTNTVAKVKKMGVDMVMLDLTDSSCRNLMPWPSKVCRSTTNNLLKATIDALHAEGLKTVVELIHNITPFEPIKWHYPQEETSRYPGMKQYPSVIHGTYFRDNWLTIEDEIMACGADGVGLSTDESYYRPAFLRTLQADDPGRALYKKRFGHEIPAREEDTLAFRQWVIMRHEGICDVYAYVSRELRKKYPNVYLNTMWMIPNLACSYITEQCIPWDMMAGRAKITELGSDYMGPYGVRMASAANGWRAATMVHSGNNGGKLPDMHYYGTVMWSWMYGAGSVNYWRYNWIADRGSIPALTRAYAMARDMDALDAWSAKPPQKIALLTSRASLDWWQVRSWWGKHDDDPNWDRGLESQRGWFATEAVFNTLQHNGYAFDWKYLDRLDQLNDLSEFKVLVMPFTYSISKAAAEKVKATVAKGATLILLDGRQGETDEWGESLAVPAFKELVDVGKAILMKEDILAWGSTDALAEKIMSAIDGALGEENPLKLTHYGKHVDATVIQKSPKEQFLFVLNWEKTPVPVDIGLSVPEGTYRVLVRDENQWSQASIAGKDKLTRKDLRKFRVNMPASKPYVFYIRESK